MDVCHYQEVLDYLDIKKILIDNGTNKWLQHALKLKFYKKNYLINLF